MCNDTFHSSYLKLPFSPGDPTWQSAAQVVTLQLFAANVGPAVPVAASILEIFRLFFIRALMSTVILQTNLYAQQVLGENSIDSWTDVTESDILAFLGFAILMGINQLTSLADYWKKDPYFHYSPIADRITRDRFLEIWKYLLLVLAEEGRERALNTQRFFSVCCYDIIRIM